MNKFIKKVLILTDPNLKSIGCAFAVNFEKDWLHSKSYKNLISRETFLLDIILLIYKGH